MECRRNFFELKGPCHLVRNELKEYKSIDILETVLEKEERETFYINRLLISKRKDNFNVTHDFTEGTYHGEWHQNFSKDNLLDVVKEQKLVISFPEWFHNDVLVPATVSIYFSELGVKRLQRFLLKDDQVLAEEQEE